MLIDRIIASIPEWTNISAKDLQKMGVNIPLDFFRKYRREFIKFMTDNLKTAPIILADEGDYDLTDCTLADLKSLKLPFKKFFIEVHVDLGKGKEVAGIFLTSEDIVKLKNADLTVYTFIGNQLLTAVYLNIEKLPRMYILCSDPCNRLNETGFIGNDNMGNLCLKTERNASCMFALGSALFLRLLVAILHRFNDTDYEIIPVSSSKHHRSTYTSKKKNTDRNIIKLSKIKRVYSSDSEQKRTHASPSPHHRRGHYRHYKTGKVVWVQATYVGGKKPEKQTIYKL